jgi:hypothetical protein
MLHERGSCVRDWASGRARVGVNEEGCPEWSQRTKARIQSDKMHQEKTQEVAIKFNSLNKNGKSAGKR